MQLNPSMKGQAVPFKKKKPLKKRYVLLSVFIPMLLVWLGWILLGVYPFGSRQILVTDCWHQYYPFLNILHEKLQHGGSLLYTWRSGMGSNFLAMAAYYAASPLNLLTILVPTAQLREAMTLLLLVKIGIAGGSMAIFLRSTFRRNDSSLCMFSISYALCSYIMGYYWNVIWMDTVALLPLVMLGLVQMIRQKRSFLYITALALSLTANYYVGLFTCLFTVIAFFCVSAFEWQGIRAFFMGGIRTLLSTAVGIGLSAFLLLPAYYALQLTHSANNAFPDTVSFYESWLDVFANMTAFRKPNVKEGLPNVYCGMLSLILTGMFLRSRGIRIREKIAAVLVLSFLLLSCNMNVLNYLWHGCHFTNMLPYRFSYLISFVVLVMGYRAFTLLLSGRMRWADSIAIAVVGIASFVIACIAREGSAADGNAYLLSGLITLFYLMVLTLHERKMLQRSICCLLLSAGVLLEMAYHVRLNTMAVNTSDYTGYPTQYAAIERILEDIEATETESFYRTEMTNVYTLNDSALYGFDGVSQFSSMANERVTTFIRTLGLPASEAGNRYYYALTSPVTNLFLGIHYVINRTQAAMDTETLKPFAEIGTVHAYENEYSMPIGFMVDEALRNYNGETFYNPFEAQNTLFSMATGDYNPLFTPIDVTHTHHVGMAAEGGVYRSGYGTYTYHIDESAEQHILQYNYVPETDAVLYAYFWADGVKNVSILQDDVLCGSYPVTRQMGFIAPIGTHQAGSKVTVSGTLEDADKSGSVRVYVYAMDKERFEAGYQKLAAGAVSLTEFSDTELTGTVNAAKDGLCYFSIPQDNGWTAEVDGETVETGLICGAMLAVPVKAGTHTIHLKYMPEGFRLGCIISLTALIFWASVGVWEYRHKKQQKRKRGRHEKFKSNDGISWNSLSRLPKAKECTDSTGGC